MIDVRADIRQHSQQDCLAASRRLPENLPRQTDLTGTPPRMTVQGPLAVPIGGRHA